MKRGLTAALASRLHRPNGSCEWYVDVRDVHAEDLRQTRAEWEAAGVTSSHVQAFDDGTLRCASTVSGTISHIGTDGYISSLPAGQPFDVFSWELDEAISANPRLSTVEVYLSRRRNTGLPAFDGQFRLSLYRLSRFGRAITDANHLTPDLWFVQLVGVATVSAADPTAFATDAAFVSFDVSGQKITLDQTFRPIASVPDEDDIVAKAVAADVMTGRVIIGRIDAIGGSNTNYGVGTDSTGTAKETTGGVGILRHKIATAFNDAENRDFGHNPAGHWEVDRAGFVAATAVYCRFSLESYPNTGNVQFLKGSSPASNLNLGGAPVGTVEFVVWIDVPAGTTAVVQAKINDADAWVTVKDGQSLTDVGLAIPSDGKLDMQVTLTPSADGKSSPTVRAIGVQDRDTWDVTRLALLSGFDSAVNPFTGEVTINEGTVELAHHGLRDYQDLATRLLRDYDFTGLSVRVRVGHPDITDRLMLGEWQVYDMQDGPERLTLTVVGPLTLLRGNYPIPALDTNGYILKAATSDLDYSGSGSSFTKEMSPGAEAATGSVTVTVPKKVGAVAGLSTISFVTPDGIPNIAHWPTGDWTFVLTVTAGDSHLSVDCTVWRVRSDGTTVEGGSRFTELATGVAGLITLSIGQLPWAVGLPGDRIRVDVQITNSDTAATHDITFELGTASEQVQTPWFPQAPSGPVSYSLQTVRAVYQDWRDGQVGLPERFRGGLPDTTGPGAELITYENLYDSEGKRTLERIAFLAQGCPIESQGVVTFAPLQRPTLGRLVGSVLLREAKVVVHPGLRQRAPQIDVKYGYFGNKPGDFAGTVRVQHQAALSRYGIALIDNPFSAVEDDICKWIPDSGLAGILGQALVRATGAGLVTADISEMIVPHPEWDIGDAIAIEAEHVLLRDPTLQAGIAGRAAFYAVITGVGDIYGRTFQAWVMAAADLYLLDATSLRRLPNELPWVQVSLQDDVTNRGIAYVRFKPVPPDATVRIYVHADGTDLPDTDSYLWSDLIGAVLTVTRDATNDVLVSYYAIRNSIPGVRETIRVRPDSTATCSLALTQSGTSPNITATATATPDTKTKRLRFYRRTGSGTWPTLDGTITGTPDPQYLTREVSVAANGGGFYKDGTGSVGALTDDGTTTRGGTAPVYASGTIVNEMAVPIDNDGNPGIIATATRTLSGTTPGKLTAITWLVTNAGSLLTPCSGGQRQYTIAWTDDANVTTSYTLKVYSTVSGYSRALVFTQANPVGTTSKTLQTSEPPASIAKHGISLTVDFDYELYDASSALVDSGTVAQSGGGSSTDSFEGQVCGA